MEGFVVLLILGALYLLPTIVALNRSHHNAGAIIVVNVFLGWTLLGWVAALAMAASATEGGGASAAWNGTVRVYDPASGDATDVPARDWQEAHARTARPCPFCGGEVAAAAKKCRHCAEWLVPEDQRAL